MYGGVPIMRKSGFPNVVINPMTDEPIVTQTAEQLCQFHAETATIFCNKVDIAKQNKIRNNIIVGIISFVILTLAFSLNIHFSDGENVVTD